MDETSTRGPLPSYEHPPVIEVVCGVQFEPLTSFQATAFGLFWQQVRDEYATTEEKPPLGSTVERFGPEWPAEAREIEIRDVPPLPRMFFIHRTPNWLIQLQRDRLLHNWRKVQDGDSYPRYPVVFEKFWTAWRRFREFCETEKLGAPKLNQLEITYINHIPADDGWKTLDDLGQVFPDFSWRTTKAFLPSPESAAYRLGFVLPESQGRLHVSLRHAMTVKDHLPVLLCELTSRGMSRTSDDAAVKAWFSMGREWIVRGFADLAGERIQRDRWGRRA